MDNRILIEILLAAHQRVKPDNIEADYQVLLAHAHYLSERGYIKSNTMKRANGQYQVLRKTWPEDTWVSPITDLGIRKLEAWEGGNIYDGLRAPPTEW